MTRIEWRFDPIPPSGSIQGGAAETFVFKPHLASFVREVLQNSHDQKAGQVPVRVDFNLYEFSAGSHGRMAIEEAIHWESLHGHLSGVAEGDGTFNLRVRQALQALDRGEPLVCLEISDTNTRGLTGGEEERGANFMALCRNVLDTPPGNKPGRGGSYGLGKAVLWLYSSISTIVFSSVLSEPHKGCDFRLIGRSVLPYHETDAERWSGLGWMGAAGTDAVDRERSVSLWGGDARDVAEPLGIARPAGRAGTSILVMGFREPYRDEARPLEEAAADMLHHATKWFWPSMTAQPPTLTVSAGVTRDGAEVWREFAKPTAEVTPFITARNAEAVQPTAPTAGDVAERRLPFRVPALRDPTEDQPRGEVNANFRLRLARTDATEPKLANRIALIRGAGMVVDYVRWGSDPTDGRPYFGVLEAGLAHGGSAEDLIAESFLRAAEPPAHDSWELTDGVRARYKAGGQARLGELRQQIGKAVADICEENKPRSARGPELLAKLLPVGKKAGRAKPPGPRFTIDFGEPTFSGVAWSLDGKVARHRGHGPWLVTLQLKLDAESGRPTVLELAHASAHGPDGALEIEGSQESAVVHVPESVARITFDIRTAQLQDEDLQRTRLVADVRPRLEGGSS